MKLIHIIKGVTVIQMHSPQIIKHVLPTTQTWHLVWIYYVIPCLLQWSINVERCCRCIHISHIKSMHNSDVIMSVMASQITSVTIVYFTFYTGIDHSKHQSSASLAYVMGIHWWTVNSPHKWPVTRKIFPFNDAIGVTRWKKPMIILLEGHYFKSN